MIPAPKPRECMVLSKHGFRITWSESKLVWLILLGVSRDIILGTRPK